MPWGYLVEDLGAAGQILRIWCDCQGAMFPFASLPWAMVFPLYSLREADEASKFSRLWIVKFWHFCQVNFWIPKS